MLGISGTWAGMVQAFDSHCTNLLHLGILAPKPQHHYALMSDHHYFPSVILVWEGFFSVLLFKEMERKGGVLTWTEDFENFSLQPEIIPN